MSKIMTLSEAIALGAMTKPQAFGELFRDGRSCAWGAALDAIGEPYGYHVSFWPWVDNISECPDTSCHERMPQEVRYLILHLNDHHRWSREKISDWVATVEPKPEQQDAVTEETSVEVTI